MSSESIFSIMMNKNVNVQKYVVKHIYRHITIGFFKMLVYCYCRDIQMRQISVICLCLIC